MALDDKPDPALNAFYNRLSKQMAERFPKQSIYGRRFTPTEVTYGLRNVEAQKIVKKLGSRWVVETQTGAIWELRGAKNTDRRLRVQADGKDTLVTLFPLDHP